MSDCWYIADVNIIEHNVLVFLTIPEPYILSSAFKETVSRDFMFSLESAIRQKYLN